MCRESRREDPEEDPPSDIIVGGVLGFEDWDLPPMKKVNQQDKEGPRSQGSSA
jgi:hypothetical protein